MGAIRPHRYGFQVDTRVDGKRRRRVLHTREEAEATLALWEGRPRGPGPQVVASEDPAPPPSTTLGDVLDGWLVHKQAISGGKKMAMQGSRNSARRLGRAFTRGLPAMALSARLLDRFIAEGRARGLRPASINHDLRALKAALRWASDTDRGALLPSSRLRCA